MMETGTEAELDAAGFAELVTRYHALVCAVAYGATGNRAASEDVAQDTFVVAWRGRHSLRDASRVRAWLCAIARHLALDTQRARRHEPIEEATATAAIDLDAHLEQAQQETLVWQAIAAIPERYRVPLVLYYREEKSVLEVAEILGISRANALQRLSRGRRHLEHGLESLVERTLTRSKPAAAHRSAIVAALGTDLVTPASADAALEAARVSLTSTSWRVTVMKVAIATSAFAGAVTLIVWGCAGGLEADAPPPTAVGTNDDDDDKEVIEDDAEARKQAQREELARAMATPGPRRADREANAGGKLPRYRLSIIDEDGIAVNLDGGPSGLMGAHEALGVDLPARSRPRERTISGRVRDADGTPVVGAVVIAGANLTKVIDASISARGGDETDAQGRFSLRVAADDTCAVLAVDPSGWSAVQHLAAATRDRTVDLTIEAPARLRGQGWRGGAHTPGTIVIRDVEDNLHLRYQTDDNGAFDVVLPPGTHEIGFRPSDERSFEDPLVRTTLEVRAGQTTSWDPRVAIGTRLAVEVTMPAKEPERVWMARVLVVPGKHVVRDEAARKSLAARVDAFDMGHFGEDLDEAFEFEDLAAGPYTICVSPEAGRGEQGQVADLGIVCQQIAISGRDEVHELKLGW